MAIVEFSGGSRRLQVAFFGRAPDEAAHRAFEERRFKAIEFSEEDIRNPVKLNATDCVIFFQREDKPTHVRHELQTYANKLLDHDCRVYVMVAKSERLQERARPIVLHSIESLSLPPAGIRPDERAKIRIDVREREGIPLAPYVYVCDTALRWSDIAQLINENPAGTAPNRDLKIEVVSQEGQAIAIDDVQTVLLQRAFSDCSAVHLTQLGGGLSGLSFRGYFYLKAGQLIPWPMPCFVKIDRRKEVEAEYANHLGASIYLPFHLAPRLDLKRCGLGAAYGILVSDFADESESLNECASCGRGTTAIANLFNKTLRAWNNTSEIKDNFTLEDRLGKFLPPTSPPNARQKLILDKGAKLSFEQLRELFFSLKSTPVRVGRIHGDLHGLNVLVRGGDALLIDFEKSSDEMPLVYDAANLEAGLLVEGFADDKRSTDEILYSVAQLYDLKFIIDWIPPCKPHEGSIWFYDCVRQIRIHASQMECQKGQYATALALALFRKGCNQKTFKGNRDELRAGAYCFAEKIFTALFDSAKR